MAEVTDVAMSNLGGPASTPPAPRPLTRERTRWLHIDLIMHGLALAGGLAIVVMLGALLTVLIVAAIPSMQRYGAHFLVGTKWQPNERQVPHLDAHGKVVRDEDGEI